MDDKIILKRLGKNIKKERIRRKLSQEKVCLFCYIDRKYLSEMERGKVNSTIKVVNKIARYFKIKLASLFS